MALRFLIRALALAAVYLCVSKLGLLLATSHGSVSPVFPATGLSIGALLVLGRRYWPAIFLGAFLSNVTSGIPLPSVFAIATGNTLEAVVAVWALSLERLRAPVIEECGEYVALLVAAILGCAVSAVIGTLSLAGFGSDLWGEVATLMWTWFVGDLLGALILVPIFQLYRRRSGGGYSLGIDREHLRSFALVALFSATAIAIFFGQIAPYLYFVLFPLLLIIALLGSELSLLLCVALAAVAASVATMLGSGPFSTALPQENFNHVQLFLVTLSITSLGLLCIKRFKVLRLSVVVLVAGWVCSAALVGYLHNEERIREETRFLSIVKEVEGKFRQRMRIYEDALRSGGSLIRASQEVSPDEWRTFVTSLEIASRYPGIMGMGLVLPVKKSETAELYERRRVETPEFAIRPVSDIEPVRADDQFVVSYIEPVEVNRGALGLDVGSEAMRRAAAERARDTGEPAMSRKISLVQDSSKEPAFLLFVPVYREMLSHDASVDERREKFRGWTYAPFITRQFFAGVEGSWGKEVTLRVFDSGAQDGSAPIYSNGSATGKLSGELSRPLPMAGQDLAVRWSRGPAFRTGSHNAEFWAGTCAALLTLMVAMVIAILSMLRYRTEALVEERTAALKASEQAARELAEKFKIASAAKSTFLANMSHEIRTPLNGIVGMSGLLLETAITGEQRDYLTSIRTCSDALLTIINDILDFSKIEAGKLSINAAPFKLRALIKGVVTIMGSNIAEKKLEVATVIDENVPDNLIGDKTRIGQVLINLLGNSAKFTPIGGGIVVQVRLLGLFDEEYALEFSVADTGIGIASEKIQAIFEPFEQVDGSTTRKYGGTGLGLSISKQLVGLMGGAISVKSAPGSGSKFSFMLRLKRCADDLRVASLDSAGVRSEKPLSVLLVEDNTINQRVARIFLERLGHLVTVAQNGKEAVELVQRGAESSFDMILMDCQMPIMNGFEAAKLVRAYEKSAGGHIPIIALTANAMDGDRELCMSAGMDDYMTKPFDTEKLTMIIQKWARSE